MPLQKQTPRGKTSLPTTKTTTSFPHYALLGLELNPLWKKRARRACWRWDVRPRAFESRFDTTLRTLDAMGEVRKSICKIFLALISPKFATVFERQQDLWLWVPTFPR